MIPIWCYQRPPREHGTCSCDSYLMLPETTKGTCSCDSYLISETTMGTCSCDSYLMLPETTKGTCSCDSYLMLPETTKGTCSCDSYCTYLMLPETTITPSPFIHSSSQRSCIQALGFSGTGSCILYFICPPPFVCWFPPLMSQPGVFNPVTPDVPCPNQPKINGRSDLNEVNQAVCVCVCVRMCVLNLWTVSPHH